MGRLATYLAVEENRLDQLWSLGDDEFRSDFLELENDPAIPRLEMDKIWDVLHCVLTGVSAANPIEGNKLSESIVGIHPRIYDDEDYSLFVSVIENGDIPGILTALADIDREHLVNQFDADRLRKQRVYPHGIWNDPPEQLVDEMLHAIESMRDYFQRITQTDLLVLATVL